MATVGHVAVGLAAARAFHDGRRLRLTEAAAWSALALLPDADVMCFDHAQVDDVVRAWALTE